MPLAMLTGRGEQTIVKGVGLNPIPDDKVFLLYARDLESSEEKALLASEVRYHPNILDFEIPKTPLYVHLDTDVINPKYAPAQRYLAPGGPSVKELSGLFKRFSNSGQVVAISLSAWYPDLDTDGKTRESSMKLLGDLISQCN